MTARTKGILEIAIMEGTRYGESPVNSEHLLLAAIIREGESVGYRILRSLRVDMKRLYMSLKSGASSRLRDGFGTQRRGVNKGREPYADAR